METVNLTSQENVTDIKFHLFPKINELIDEGLLSPELAAQRIVGMISSWANGMFFWAKLLLEYLRFPDLTFYERKDAILNLNRLEGLDALYEEILSKLEGRVLCSSRVSFRGVFQWVACARRPLLLEELRIALSVPIDRRQSNDDVIPNFQMALGPLAGSLAEVASGNIVQFVHLSALEYFYGCKMNNNSKPKSASCPNSGLQT